MTERHLGWVSRTHISSIQWNVNVPTDLIRYKQVSWDSVENHLLFCVLILQAYTTGFQKWIFTAKVSRAKEATKLLHATWTKKTEVYVCCSWASGPCRGMSEGVCIAVGDHPRFSFHMYTWLEGIVGQKHREPARIAAVLLQEAKEEGPVLTAAPWLIRPLPTPWAKSLGGWHLRTHLAHSDGITLCQDNFWGVCNTCELQLVCRLAILLVTQDFTCSLHLLDLYRANGNPSDASQPLKISLVHSLQR